MRGPLVFSIKLPLELAPTLNVYARREFHSLKPELRKRILDAFFIEQHSGRYPNARASYSERAVMKRNRRGIPMPVTERVGEGLPREVVLTRHSSREPDELSVDAIGGKLPVDCLVRAGILVDDNREWCVRTPDWKKAREKDGFVTIEVYETLEVKAS